MVMLQGLSVSLDQYSLRVCGQLYLREMDVMMDFLSAVTTILKGLATHYSFWGCRIVWWCCRNNYVGLQVFYVQLYIYWNWWSRIVFLLICWWYTLV